MRVTRLDNKMPISYETPGLEPADTEVKGKPISNQPSSKSLTRNTALAKD